MIKSLEILKALSDRNRLRIVMALGHCDELCACQITELLQVTGATASRHLSVLQYAGILSSRKEGRWMYYRLAPPAGSEAVFDWLNASLADAEELRSDQQSLDQIMSITREALCRMQRGETCCPAE